MPSGVLTLCSIREKYKNTAKNYQSASTNSRQIKSYTEKLSTLSLPSPLHRRHRRDLILLYKIINNYFNSNFTNLLTYSIIYTRDSPVQPEVTNSNLYLIQDFYIDLIIAK